MLDYFHLTDAELNAQISERTGVVADYANDDSAALRLWRGVVGFSLMAGSTGWRAEFLEGHDGDQLHMWHETVAQASSRVWLEFDDWRKAKR